MERLGRETSVGRDLFLLDARRPEDVTALANAPSPRFVALLVWDAAAAPTETVVRVAESLLTAGCVYACVWGDDCERVHDVIDEVDLVADLARPEDDVVMTTWHAGESLDDALWFLLAMTHPSDGLAEGCESSVVICIGQDRERVARVRFALAHPRAFLDEVGERGSP